MRKSVKFTTIILSALLVLTACGGNKNTKVSDGDSVIATINETVISKNDIYNYSKLRFGQTMITSNLINMQLDKYVTLSADDEKLAKEKLEEARESMKENFEEIVVASGYKDVDDYYERFILKEIKVAKLFDQYFSENITTIVEGLNSRKIRVLKAANKADAEAALKELEEIKDLDVEKFLETAKQYSKEEVVADSKIEHIYTGRTENKYLNTTLKDSKPGLIKEVIINDEGFDIVYIEELDLEVDKEMIQSSIKANETVDEIITKAMYAHFSVAGDFKIHDKELYDLFKENNPFLSE